MEVMGLMLGEFVDEYTVTVVDVFAMPQSDTGVSVEADGGDGASLPAQEPPPQCAPPQLRDAIHHRSNPASTLAADSTLRGPSLVVIRTDRVIAASRHCGLVRLHPGAICLRSAHLARTTRPHLPPLTRTTRRRPSPFASYPPRTPLPAPRSADTPTSLHPLPPRIAPTTVATRWRRRTADAEKKKMCGCKVAEQ
ncbi:hypothetical protein ZWY2020_021010 [Hordeum vulgare]|nr:hypothetical protein ZWY2020_021010 [Hordeum vulgare]